MYAYVRAMCGWLDVLRSFSVFSRLSLFFFFLFGGRTGEAYKFLLVRVCVSFYFGFLSLVVRTAELDGGCMRLSRDHMWVLSPLILIPHFAFIFAFIVALLQTSSFSLSLSLSMSNASARYSRGLGHTATKSWNVTCLSTKDEPMSVTRIHKFFFVCPPYKRIILLLENYKIIIYLYRHILIPQNISSDKNVPLTPYY